MRTSKALNKLIIKYIQDQYTPTPTVYKHLQPAVTDSN